MNQIVGKDIIAYLILNNFGTNYVVYLLNVVRWRPLHFRCTWRQTAEQQYRIHQEQNTISCNRCRYRDNKHCWIGLAVGYLSS